MTHIHFLGICGYAVGGAALLAQELGETVTGSDAFAYPPLSDRISQAGIHWVNHYSADNLTRWGRPDLVVVGNNVRLPNPEWEEVVRTGIAYESEIGFFARVAKDRTRAAIVGSHGKTTTASLVAWILDQAGRDPGFRIGGIVRNLDTGTRLGTGPFVFEGDEYTTALWDSRPKFAHIRPSVAGVVALDWDHPDVYPSLAAYLAPFVDLAKDMPEDGVLILPSRDPLADQLADRASCRVETYGESEGSHWRLSEFALGSGQSWTLTREGESFRVHLPRPGMHDALNATCALACAAALGVPLADAVAACSTFLGPGRRYEKLAEGEITVIDDYAHHPTEARAVLRAARREFPSSRIIAIHTPHTFSRTEALIADYGDCLSDADIVVLGPIDAARERGRSTSLTSDTVRAAIVSPTDVRVVSGVEDAFEEVVSLLSPGDVLVVLSLSGFDKIAEKLAAAVANGLPATRGPES